MQASAPAGGVLHWYYTGITPRNGTLGRSGHSGQHQLNIDTAPPTTPLRVPPRLDHTNTTLVRRQPRPEPRTATRGMGSQARTCGPTSTILVPHWWAPAPRIPRPAASAQRARQYHTCTTPTPRRYCAGLRPKPAPPREKREPKCALAGPHQYHTGTAALWDSALRTSQNPRHSSTRPAVP